MPVHKSDKVTFQFSSRTTMANVRKFIEDGRAQRIILTNKSGDVVLEVPLAAAIVGVAISPIIAILSAATAFYTECTITVVKREKERKVV